MDIFMSDSDWDSSSESGMEDQVDFLYGGQARSILSSLEQSIEKIDDFLSFERGFTHGDMVFSAMDPSGQKGRIVGIDMLVDLENIFGNKIEGVNSKNLLKIRSFSVGDYVVSGPWIGKIDKVVDRITIVFDDGTKFEVNATEQEKLQPLSPNVLDDVQLPFYPGQRVRFKLSNASKSAGWLCGTWKNQDEGTVCEVEAGLLLVDWFASVLTVSNPDLPSPPRLLDSKKATLLSCFLSSNWQLGDWCKLPNFESRKRNLGSVFVEVCEIVKTKTKVNVVWQDGDISVGLDSQTLIPVNVVNSYEFWPHQFVTEKGTVDDPLVSSSRNWGVVLGMDAKDLTVKVLWNSPEMDGLDGEKMVETVSAYELVEHPDFNFCFGDLVSKIIHTKFDDQAEKENPKSMAFDEDDTKGNGYGNDKNMFTDTRFLPYIGIVTGFKHGAVEVKWATGTTSKVEPTEILRVDINERSASFSRDEDVEDSSEEMTEHEKQTSYDKKDRLNSDGNDGCKKQLWNSASFFLPQAAIGFFTNIASSLLKASASTQFSEIPIDGTEPEDHGENKLKETELCTATEILNEFDTHDEKVSNEEVQKVPNDRDYSEGNENLKMFRLFDMAADCPDHHFFSSSRGNSLSQVKRSWLKKVQQEWSILEKNLPDTIFVRIFEERMDLIRAAIVGAPGTPYHDGLFLFDIYLPPQYPQEPPMVHYNSGGLRLNPNLYESGKVCLSLLNTWAGSGTEVWNPESTVLQLLLSLQALVLNDKPYFNEAGYDQQIGKAEGEKNSISYNENAYLVTCKSMLYLLRNPPKHFEGLVDEHFGWRAQHILTACEAYMEEEESSKGFKIMLSKLVPKLAQAFSDKGIDFSHVKMPEK